MLDEALPAELLATIWCYADSRTLKEIRLVNRGHGEVATKVLFKDVYITLLPLFLRKLEAIANFEHLGKHVKTLGFHSKLLDPKYVHHQTFEEAINLREPFFDWCNRYDYCPSAPGRQLSWLNHLERHELPPAVIRLTHLHFLDFYADQQAMIHTKEDIGLLSHVLRKLPNLEELNSVSISHGMERHPPDELYCFKCLDWQKHAYNAHILDKDHPMPILSTIQDRVWLPNPFFAEDEFHDDRGREIPLTSLFTALGLAKKPLRRVELGQVHPGFWLYPLPKEIAPLLRDAFQNVSMIALHIDIKPDEYGYSDHCFEEMAEFVQNGAPLVQSLLLSLTGWVILAQDPDRITHEGEGDHSESARWPDMPDPLDISLFLNGLTLSRLTVLIVRFCRFQGKSFVDFMTRHADTLNHLRMDIVRMSASIAGRWEPKHPSLWEQALQQIAPVMSLENATLAWLFDDSLDKLQAYLPGPKDKELYSGAYAAGAANYLLSRGRSSTPPFGQVLSYPERAYALGPPT